MKNAVPLDKQSKKARSAYYTEQRGSWHGISPVTRVVPSRKVYDRNRSKQAARRAFSRPD